MKRTAAAGPRRAPKAAKTEPEEDAGAAKARALAAAGAGGALAPAAALVILDATTPCAPGGCRRARPDAPNCLCRLAPSAGGHREAGLWARVPAALAALGDDPSESHRTARFRLGGCLARACARIPQRR